MVRYGRWHPGAITRRERSKVMARAFAEIAFTPAVRAEQARQGSAGSYAKFFDADAAARDSLGAAEAAFVAERDGFYQATVGETGWPYVQFRGGPRGFLKIGSAHVSPPVTNAPLACRPS